MKTKKIGWIWSGGSPLVLYESNISYKFGDVYSKEYGLQTQKIAWATLFNMLSVYSLKSQISWVANRLLVKECADF